MVSRSYPPGVTRVTGGMMAVICDMTGVTGEVMGVTGNITGKHLKQLIVVTILALCQKHFFVKIFDILCHIFLVQAKP